MLLKGNPAKERKLLNSPQKKKNKQQPAKQAIYITQRILFRTADTKQDMDR